MKTFIVKNRPINSVIHKAADILNDNVTSRC